MTDEPVKQSSRLAYCQGCGRVVNIHVNATCYACGGELGRRHD